jgi:hypothetical protein
MAKRKFELQSRNIYCGPETRSFSELFEFSAQVDFADDGLANNDFDIEIRSDYQRWKESANYMANQQYMGNLSTTNRIKVRHNIQIGMRVGFYGSFYKYTITKKIPTDGFFNWNGCQMSAIPMNVDQEFMATLDTITVGW